MRGGLFGQMAEIKFVKMRFTDAKALKKCCDAYFERIDAELPHIVTYGKHEVTRYVPYVPAGLARALGISTQTMGKYLRGEVSFPETMDQKTQMEILHVLTDARNKIEENISTRALMGEIDNAVSRQVLGTLGYNKSLDEAGEEANNTVKVIIQGASKEEVESWAK